MYCLETVLFPKAHTLCTKQPQSLQSIQNTVLVANEFGSFKLHKAHRVPSFSLLSSLLSRNLDGICLCRLGWLELSESTRGAEDDDSPVDDMVCKVLGTGMTIHTDSSDDKSVLDGSLSTNLLLPLSPRPFPRLL